MSSALIRHIVLGQMMLFMGMAACSRGASQTIAGQRNSTVASPIAKPAAPTPTSRESPAQTAAQLSFAAEELLQLRGSQSASQAPNGYIQLKAARLAYASKDYSNSQRLAEASWAEGATGEAMMLAGMAALAQGDRTAASDRFGAGLEQFRQTGFAPTAWPSDRCGGGRASWVGDDRILLGACVFDRRTGIPLTSFDALNFSSSREGRWLAASESNNSLRIWDDWLGSWTRVDVPLSSGHVQFSADGKWLSIQTAAEVAVLSTSNWRVAQVFSAELGNSASGIPCWAVFSEDSSEIAYQRVVGEVVGVNLDGMPPRWSLKVPISCEHIRLSKSQISVAFQNKLLRVVRRGNKLGARSTLDANRLIPLPEGKWGYLSYDMSTDGSRWLLQTTQGDLALLDTVRRKAVWSKPGESFSHVALGGAEYIAQGAHGLCVMSSSTGTCRDVPDTNVPTVLVANPVKVGKDLWFEDNLGRIWIWSRPGDSGPPDLKGPLGAPLPSSGKLVASPSARWVAQTYANRLRLWDTSTTKIVKEIEIPRDHGEVFFIGKDDDQVGIGASRSNKAQVLQTWSTGAAKARAGLLDAQCVRVLSGGSTIVALYRSGIYDDHVAISDEGGKPRCNFKDRLQVGSWSMNRNGTRLAYVSERNLLLYDTMTCRQIGLVAKEALGGANPKPHFLDSTTVLISANQKLYTWNTKQGGNPRLIVETTTEFPWLGPLVGDDRLLVRGDGRGLGILSISKHRLLGELQLRSINPKDDKATTVVELLHADGTVGFFGGEIPNQTFCAVGPYVFPFDACRSRLQSQRGFDRP